MECPTILNLHLGPRDKKALKEIRGIHNAANALKTMLFAGMMGQLFIGNKAWEANINIYSTDWMLFTKAMQSIPAIAKKRISIIANLQQFRPTLTHKQSQFWKAIAAGCKGN